MKRSLIILFFLMYSLQTQEAGHKVTYLLVTEPLRPFDRLWEAVCQVESGGDPLAIGDKHLKKHSFGIAQIREDRLMDFNQKTGKSYTKEDLFDKEISKSIFMHYADGDYEVVARNWNAGPGGWKKKSTLDYWKKISISLTHLNHDKK